MTELDSTTQPLWRIHQYEKALTLASIASAAKPFWLEQDIPTGFQVPDALREQMANTPGWNGPEGSLSDTESKDPVSKQQGNGTPTQVVKPASRETLPPGLKMKQADPKFPQENAPEFRKDNMRDIAVGVGLSYQHVSGDFQNLGFIAGLMCQIPAQEYFRVRQKNLVDGGLDEIFRRWLRSAIMKGYFDKRGVNIPISILDDLCEAAHFKGRGWPFVNPLVQAQALILLNEAGHLTRQQVQDQLPQGMSFEKLVSILKKETAILAQAGLGYNDIDATRPTISKGEPGQAEPAPTAPGGAPGGPADVPPKSKTANPLRQRDAGLQRLGISMDALVQMSH
jgi:capsid protein